MSKKIIPQTEQITCDVCQRIVDKLHVFNSCNGKLILKQDGLDYSGCPVGDASWQFDLCDNCLDKIGSAINKKIEEIRNSNKGEIK